MAGILEKLLGGTATLSGITSNYQGDRLLPTSQGGQSNTDIDVNIETALRVSAWYAADRILSEQFALCPLKLKKRLKNGGSEEALDHPLYKLMLMKPNGAQNAYKYKQHIFSHRFFNGNMYSYKLESSPGVLRALVPLAPWRVQPMQKLNGEIYYKYTDENQKVHDFRFDQVFHWAGKTIDGIVGISMISYAASQIGIAIKQDEHSEWMLENRAEPSGIISVQNPMKKEAYDLARQQMKERAEGAKNAGKTLILDNGAKYERISMTPQDMQLLEDKKFGIAVCSRYTGVPKSLLSDNSESNWNNMTEENRHFLEYGLKSHLVSFEMEANTSLLDEKEQGKYFFEFDKSAFKEMDDEKRSIAMLNLRYGGVIKRDEAREEFGYKPLGGAIGEEVWRPENMAPADAPYEPNNPTKANQATAGNPDSKPATEPSKPAKKTEKVSKNSLKAAFSGVFQQVFSKMQTKTYGQYERLSKKSTKEDALVSIREFLKEQTANYSTELRPAVNGVAKAFGDIPLSLEAELDKAVINLVDMFSAGFIESGGNLSESIGEEAITKLLEVVEAHHE